MARKFKLKISQMWMSIIIVVFISSFRHFTQFRFWHMEEKSSIFRKTLIFFVVQNTNLLGRIVRLEEGERFF